MKLFISILYALLFTLTYALCEEISTITSKELYIKYTNYPNTVYDKQRFSVTLEARILTNRDDFNSIMTTFQNNKSVDILTKNIIWKDIGNNIYTTTIAYKVRDKHFKLPTIRLTLEHFGEGYRKVDFIEIKAPSINYTQIAINQENFSNIIASDLYIKKFKQNNIIIKC